MPELWLPGATRVPGNNGLRAGAGGGTAFKFHTWHTFEGIDKDYNYSPDCVQAAKYLNSQGSTATFCFNIKTGAIAQLLPANQAARTLKAAVGYPNDVNRYGAVHMQTEVLANAARPWHLDITPAGKIGLQKLINFLRSWGIPDQWAWPNQPPPAYPGPGVTRKLPTRSGHTYHAGWPYNNHGDPGRIADPWSITEPDIVRAPGSRWTVTADPLNARGGPSTTYPIVGEAPTGTVIQATGRTSGRWMEGQTPYQIEHAMTAWYHSDHLIPYVAPPKPPEPPADEPEPPVVTPPLPDLSAHRVGGADRYQTAVAWASFDPAGILPQRRVILAAHNGYSDMAAAQPHGTVLPVSRGSERVHGAVLAEIARREPLQVLAAGDQTAVTDAALYAALQAAGLED